jgi:trehalose 6-phosphate phosphatase
MGRSASDSGGVPVGRSASDSGGVPVGGSASDSGGLPADVMAALDAAAATRHLLVTSDFDGTLAPIVSNPADARPLPAAAAALSALAELPSTSVALISGRALSVLRELSGAPPTVHLVGSHGAEFDTGGQERSDAGKITGGQERSDAGKITGGQERSDAGKIKGGQERSDAGKITGGQERSDAGKITGFAHDVDGALLERITADLTAIAAGRPGVTVETKPASVAMHVRNASAADGDAALAEARAAAQAWDAQATEGKAVLEFAVVTTDKGEAVDILRDQTGATSVAFFGDDVTDENAFRRMRDTDVGVKVGPGQTLAKYRIGSPDDVAAALEYLLARRRSASR